MHHSPLRLPYAIVLLVAAHACGAAPAFALGAYPGFVDVVTDSAAVFAIPDASKPPYLHALTDPTFGTRVTRITGYLGSTFQALNGSGTWGDDARHHYSKDQPWNSDGTLFEVQNSGTPKHLILDGETFAVLYGKCPNYIVGDDRWHPSPQHPHERINVRGTELSWFDVTTCEITRLWTLPFEPIDMGGAEGNPSSDGRFLALNDSARVFVVDMDPGPPFAPYPASRVGPVRNVTDCGYGPCAVKWVSMSPSGRYVVVNYEGDHLRVFDVDPATLALSPHAMPAGASHCSGVDPARGFVYDLGHADLSINPFSANDDVLIGQESCGNRGTVVDGQLVGGVVMVRLRDGAITSLTDPTNESYPHHVSARNVDRPGWVYVGYWPYEGKRFADEIVAVRMDGSKVVQRFAHKHSAFAGCYRCESHAVPSRDGRRIVWASNWSLHCTLCGTPDDVKAYVIDARDDLGNLIGNASFEYNSGGWAGVNGAIVVRVPGGVDGDFGARVTAAAGSTSEFGINDSPNWVKSVHAGQRYRVTAWIRSTTAHGSVSLRLREYVGGKAVGSASRSANLRLDQEWQRLVVERVAGAEGASLDLQVVAVPEGAGETFEIDDIVIAETSSPTTEVPLDPRPSVAARIAPNPAGPSSALEFSTLLPGRVRVRAFDANGRLIATLADGWRPDGPQRLPLGPELARRRWPAGLYFLQVDTVEGVGAARLIVLE